MELQSLSLGIICVALSCLIELSLYVLPIWNHKRQIAAVSLVFLAFGTGAVVANSWWPLATVFAVICIYKAFSLLRLVRGRTTDKRLYSASKQSFLWLFSGLVVVTALIVFAAPTLGQVAFVIGIGGLLLSTIFAIGTFENILESKPDTGAPLSDKELPTITIAIPARNETEGLAACLEAALASDYPKLEIIVLDDCSQDRTAEVIKSFAHDGVRFLLGEVTPDEWLAKNYAYKQLLEEASGEYVLFMGVDIRLHSTSVRSLIQAMIQNNQTMVSVLPRRTQSGLAAAFVQPMRYFWELAIPPSLKKWPPVLSSCWVVNRKAALKQGGFESVKRAILPERHFALSFGTQYAFKRTSESSVITTHKDFQSQWSTAIRTRYPQLHRRPELVAFQVIGLSLFVLAPFVMVFIAHEFVVQILCVLAVLLYTSTHVAITAITNRAALWLAPFNVFFAVILDIAALNVSMYLYEFREVYWKGRNVCVPVMRVVPKLPNIDNIK